MFGIGKHYREAGRLKDIVWVFSKHGLGGLIDRIGLGHLIPFGAKKQIDDEQRIPERLCSALDELGSTFVKFGQVLSARPDILPQSYIQALSRLQDQATPLPFDQLRPTVEKDLGGTLDTLFQSVDPTPLASASIAQVHRAVLVDGREVVLKIRRPNVEKQIEADLSILARLAAIVERAFPELVIIQPRMIIDEFGRMLHRELDFMGEAAETMAFARSGTTFRIPTVIWERTANHVLCLEYLPGMPLRDWMASHHDAAERRTMALRIGQEFMRQYFEVGVFHADPHPGNLFVQEDGQVVLLDFGAIGRLDPDLKLRLGLALLALLRNDPRLLTAIYIDVGEFEQDVDRDTAIADIEMMTARYSGMPASKIDLANLFSDLMEIARGHRLRLPRSFVMLGRGDILVSHMIRQLSPDISMVEMIKPFARKLIKKQLGPDSLFRLGATAAYDLANLAHHLPYDLRTLVRQARTGKLNMQVLPDLKRLENQIDRSANRMAYALIISGLGLTSALLMAVKVPPTVHHLLWVVGIVKSQTAFQGFAADMLSVSVPGIIGLSVATVLALRLLWDIERGHRK
ncbi:MAG: ABC1 kinase family protein [Planctomycetota bacterium]